jgi:hypothetical protein
MHPNNIKQTIPIFGVGFGKTFYYLEVSEANLEVCELRMESTAHLFTYRSPVFFQISTSAPERGL